MERCFTSRPVSKASRSSADRLTSLPDELVSRIVGMLPTKDVAVTRVLCKSMRRLAFTCLTSLDLDDSPVSHCRDFPHRPDRFPLFVSFVDHVLNNLSLSGRPLTRFRLHVGGDKTTYFQREDSWHSCYEACFPDLRPSRLNTWISYPLAHRGIRELDLSFHVRNPSHCTLPHQLFACHFLEVLKLDSNLNLGADEFSLISLPNLKRLHLYSFRIVRDDFLTKLVSRCPSLEDLECNCQWVHSDRLAVSSKSLRRLELIIDRRRHDEEKNADLVVIDTPNLLYFHFRDNLAIQYSISNMNALVQANLDVILPLRSGSLELSYQIQRSLVRLVPSNVQHLSLLGCSVENIYFGGESSSKDQLPMFRNLKTLELGSNSRGARWDKTLFEILACSPNLEILVFPEGLFFDMDRWEIIQEVGLLEDEGLGSSEAIPLCFQSNLKRIVIQNYFRTARELCIIKFLLQTASILHELEIICSSENESYHVVPIHELASTLTELPRASITCSI